jgi:hypothetical protein
LASVKSSPCRLGWQAQHCARHRLRACRISPTHQAHQRTRLNAHPIPAGSSPSPHPPASGLSPPAPVPH